MRELNDGSHLSKKNIAAGVGSNLQQCSPTFVFPPSVKLNKTLVKASTLAFGLCGDHWPPPRHREPWENWLHGIFSCMTKPSGPIMRHERPGRLNRGRCYFCLFNSIKLVLWTNMTSGPALKSQLPSSQLLYRKRHFFHLRFTKETVPPDWNEWFISNRMWAMDSTENGLHQVN